MFHFRRLTSFMIAVVMIFCSCGQAFAAEYNLADGDIAISADSSGQTVSQGSFSQKDNDVIITSNGVSTSNTVTVSSTDGAVASFTVSELEISTNTGNAIDIADGSTVEMNVSGENSIYVYNHNTASGIHVGDAQLTITGAGDKKTDDVLNIETNGNVWGAVIGSNKNEDFDGNITITDVTVNVVNDSGMPYAALIGSGDQGDVNGSILIDNAIVTAESGHNTGIGTGTSGDLNGTIEITDSTVDVETNYYGSGIGSGWSGDIPERADGTANIVIKNSEVTVVGGSMAAGIGTGEGGILSGKIEITDSTVEASSRTWGGAGIGSGYGSDFEGTITIDNSEVTAIGSSYGDYFGGAGVGTGAKGNFSGTLVITDSTVNAESKSQGAGIGTGSSGNFEEQGQVTIKNSVVNVTANGKNGACIGAGVNGSYAGDVTLIDGTKVSGADNNYDVLLGTTALKYAEGDGTITMDTSAQIHHDTLNERMQGNRIYDSIGGATLILLSESNETSGEGETDRFWYLVENRIRNADSGEMLTVDAAYRTTMPSFVMDAIRECGVILVIQWDGGDDITIRKAYDGDVEYKVFKLSELNALLDNHT